MPLTSTVLRHYDAQAPTDTETATFGLGCFWGPDAAFGAIDGVVRTRVGYAGGTRPDPTYEAIGDHTEVVQLEYDPEQVSFRDLVATAFDHHTPHQQPRKRQYHHILFTTTDEQASVIAAYLDAGPYDRAQIETRIEPLGTFHVAENYHQKYNLRGKRWLTEPFADAGYDDVEIRDSPAAAKLNAQVAGHDIEAPVLDPAGTVGERAPES